MLKIFKYLRWQDWLTVALIAGFNVLGVWLELKMPEFMRTITLNITVQNANVPPADLMPEIWADGGWMLLCAFGSLITSLITTFLATGMSASFAARLRQKMFEKVESFSAAEISKFSTASLITRTTNDVQQVQMITGMGTNLLIRAPIMAIWSLVKITSNKWQFVAVTAAAIIVMLVLVITLVSIALPKFRKVQTLTDNLNRLTRENLTGLRVVRAYNAEGYQEEKFEKANEEMRKTQMFTNRLMQAMMPSLTLVMSGLTLGISLIAAMLIYNAQPAPGSNWFGVLEAAKEQGALYADMMTFSQYAMMAVMAFMMLVMIFVLAPRAAVSAKRVLEVLNTETSIKENTSLPVCTTEQGTVEFKNVSFKYPDAEEYVLENISFKADKGETVAFIGSTGSGKSTLINLIPRFYDATEGAVLVDGIDVKDHKIKELNNRIGYIAQKGVIFSGSVRGNVAFGDSGKIITEPDIETAIKTAQAEEFVKTLEGGLEAHIAQGGANLSGGQKQRLSISRALAKKPEILIFDDSFSALDYKTDRNLRAALKSEFDGTTRLIVAQRIGTIKDADKIVVLDDGKMVGCGTHAELLKDCPVYQEIALSQLSKEELGYEG